MGIGPLEILHGAFQGRHLFSVEHRKGMMRESRAADSQRSAGSRAGWGGPVWKSHGRRSEILMSRSGHRRGAILEPFQLPSFTQTIGVSYCRAAQGDMPKFLV
jgi:hypothetical protein